MAFLLDTTFLIDLQRQDPAAVKLLKVLMDENSTLIVPTIVLSEFLVRTSDRPAATEKILETAVVLQFTVEDAQAAARIASDLIEGGQFPGWSDVFIAGVAEHRGRLPIITRNPKHFPASVVRTY